MYVIKQDTGFIPYFLTAWDEKTDSFSAWLKDAHEFPNMQAALVIANTISARWRLRNGQSIIPLKVVPANTNHGRAAMRVVSSESQRRMTMAMTLGLRRT